MQEKLHTENPTRI